MVSLPLILPLMVSTLRSPFPFDIQYPMFVHQYILVTQISWLHVVLLISIIITWNIILKRFSHLKYKRMVCVFTPLIPSNTYTIKQMKIISKVREMYIVLYDMWNLCLYFIFLFLTHCLKEWRKFYQTMMYVILKSRKMFEVVIFVTHYNKPQLQIKDVF